LTGLLDPGREPASNGNRLRVMHAGGSDNRPSRWKP